MLSFIIIESLADLVDLHDFLVVDNPLQELSDMEFTLFYGFRLQSLMRRLLLKRRNVYFKENVLFQQDVLNFE
jgi:hypothetical protein